MACGATAMAGLAYRLWGSGDLGLELCDPPYRVLLLLVCATEFDGHPVADAVAVGHGVGELLLQIGNDGGVGRLRRFRLAARVAVGRQLVICRHEASLQHGFAIAFRAAEVEQDLQHLPTPDFTPSKTEAGHVGILAAKDPPGNCRPRKATSALDLRFEKKKRTFRTSSFSEARPSVMLATAVSRDFSSLAATSPPSALLCNPPPPTQTVWS